MTAPTQQGLASCPSCGAAVRPGADWCTLCFTDLRPLPAPVAVTAAPVALSAVPVSAQPTDPQGGVGAADVATIPCPRCASPMNPLEDVCPACGVGLFDGLASDRQATLRLPLIGDVMSYSRNARMAGAAIFSTTLASVVVGVIAAVAKIF